MSYLAPTQPAQAQIGKLLFGNLLPADGVSVKLRKGNVIRAHAVLGRNESVSEAFRRAMARIAIIAKDNGYERIGMTKQNCGTMMISGIPATNECRILAQMVRDDENAKPEGKNPVHYYRVSSILNGAIVPEESDKEWQALKASATQSTHQGASPPPVTD